jgi:surface antigen
LKNAKSIGRTAYDLANLPRVFAELHQQSYTEDVVMKQTLRNLALLTTIILVGCSTNTQNENTGIGAVTGGAIGGLAGSAIGGGTGKAVAVGAGIVLGALVGGTIGHSMDSGDKTQTNTVIKNNPTNHATRWTNPNTGMTYTMTPTSDMFAMNGNSNCRKYHFTATKPNGKMHSFNGTACLMNDGYWHTVRG